MKGHEQVCHLGAKRTGYTRSKNRSPSWNSQFYLAYLYFAKAMWGFTFSRQGKIHAALAVDGGTRWKKFSLISSQSALERKE
jgi:hypothetical protein